MLVCSGTFLNRKYPNFKLVHSTHTHSFCGWCRMGWSSEGIEVISNMTKDNVTTVQCSSTHLTSFAVLVGVGGGQV